jgi:hypothetical protein
VAWVFGFKNMLSHTLARTHTTVTIPTIISLAGLTADTAHAGVDPSLISFLLLFMLEVAQVLAAFHDNSLLKNYGEGVGTDPT